MNELEGGPGAMSKCRRVLVQSESELPHTRTVGVVFDKNGRPQSWGDGMRLSPTHRRIAEKMSKRGGLCLETDAWVYWRKSKTIQPNWNQERMERQREAGWPGRILKPRLPRLRPGQTVPLSGLTRRLPLL